MITGPILFLLLFLLLLPFLPCFFLGGGLLILSVSCPPQWFSPLIKQGLLPMWFSVHRSRFFSNSTFFLFSPSPLRSQDGTTAFIFPLPSGRTRACFPPIRCYLFSSCFLLSLHKRNRLSHYVFFRARLTGPFASEVLPTQKGIFFIDISPFLSPRQLFPRLGASQPFTSLRVS